MNLIVEDVQREAGSAPVTVVGIHGDLDGSNYQELITKAKELYKAGARNIVLDMSDMLYMSSAGLVALHSVAMLLRGEEPPDPSSGWNAYHAVARDRDTSTTVQRNLKLVNPQPKVERTLQLTGMKEFFEVHPDLKTAVASF